MDKNQVIAALKNGKEVSVKDYENLLKMQGCESVIAYLEERFTKTKNPNIENEIQRLKSNKPLRMINTKKQGEYKPDDTGNKGAQIAPADSHLNYQHRDINPKIHQVNNKRSPQSRNTPDSSYHKPDRERFLYVHHDDEPYVDRKIVIPEDDKEFEALLLQASLDNPNYYEFLKDERRRRKKYQ